MNEKAQKIMAFVDLARDLGCEHGGLVRMLALLEQLDERDREFAEAYYFVGRKGRE